MAETEQASPDGTEQRHIRDAYGVALLLVFSAVFTLIAAGAPVASPLAAFASALLATALVVTLRVSGVRRRNANILSSVLVLAFLAAAGGLVLGTDAGEVTFVIAWVLLTLATIASIGRRLATYHRVSLQLVMGLLAIYLLLGLEFGLLYVLAETLGIGAFAQGTQGASGAVYFSFVTLATLGYGDISPAAPLVRALSVAEAVIGQLYLVSVVSLAVSRMGVLRQPVEARENA